MTTGRPIYLLTVFALLLSLLFMYKAKTAQIYGRLDDAVNVSCQSVCIPDRYAPGSRHWNREDVVFSTESAVTSELYLSDAMEATKYAANLAYRRIKEMLDYNFPSMVTDYRIEQLAVVNIISGRAYEYNVLTGTDRVEYTMETESYLWIKVRVQLELPLFGNTEWIKEEKVVLWEEYS